MLFGLDGQMIQFTRNSMSQEKRLFIVGTGIIPASDASLLSVKVISSVDLCVTPNQTHQMVEFISKYNDNIIDISELYRNHLNRHSDYKEMAIKVTDYFETNESIAYVTYGSATLLDEPSRLLNTYCLQHSITVEIIPAVSFIERFCSATHVFIDTLGFQFFEASHILNVNFKIDPTIPTIISQIIGLGEISKDSFLSLSIDDLGEFAVYLRDFYPPNHLVTLFELSYEAGGISKIDIPLAGLPLLFECVSVPTSLFVPPISRSG